MQRDPTLRCEHRLGPGVKRETAALPSAVLRRARAHIRREAGVGPSSRLAQRATFSFARPASWIVSARSRGCPFSRADPGNVRALPSAPVTSANSRAPAGRARAGASSSRRSRREPPPVPATRRAPEIDGEIEADVRPRGTAARRNRRGLWVVHLVSANTGELAMQACWGARLPGVVAAIARGQGSRNRKCERNGLMVAAPGLRTRRAPPGNCPGGGSRVGTAFARHTGARPNDRSPDPPPCPPSAPRLASPC